MATAKAKDFTATVNEALAALPIDTKALEDAYRASTVVNEKLSGVALSAAEKTNEITSKSVQDTLAALANVGKAKAEPADYASAVADFAKFATELAVKNVSTYVEITRNAQTEATELLVAAGKDASTEVTALVQKATDEATKAVKKAAKAA